MPQVGYALYVLATAAGNAAGFIAFKLGASLALSTAINAFVAKYAISLLVMAGSITYSSIEQRKARAALNKGRTFMVREPAAPRQIVYGEVKTSGPIVFMDATGTKNEYLHIIVALASHPCEAIGTVYLNDDALTLDGSGNATGSPYAGYVTVAKYLGSASQTVALAGSTSPRWTSNHRLRGITCVAVRLKWSAEVFPNGIPNISAIVQGKNDIVDYRDSSTGYTNNWALCLADYLTSPLGLGDDTSRLDTTTLNTAANDSDEAVELADTSTEPRYTCNGVVLTDAAPGDVIETMVSNAAGFCGFIGGKWVIHAGTYRTPTLTIDESCLRGPIKVQTKVSRADSFNGIKGVFSSPDNNWQPADFPPVTNATYTTQDQGVRIWRDVEYAFITSNATTQRVSKIALERVRQEITVELKCNMKVASAQAGDNVMLTLTRPGWSSKVFEVVSCTFVPEEQDGAMALGYDLVLRETASGVWDWANGEETTIDLAPNTNLPDPRTVAAPTSLLLESGSTEIYQQADGTVIPRIKATWTLPADEFVQSGGSIRIEFKKSADSTWLPWTVVRGDVAEEYLTDVEDGVAYDVRIRSENTLAVGSSWVSDSITVGQKTSAPSDPTGVTYSTTFSTHGFPPPRVDYSGEALFYAGWLFWDLPSEQDVDEVEIFFAPSSSAPSNADAKQDSRIYDARQPKIPYYVYAAFILNWHAYLRYWDRSGNKSDWVDSGALGSTPNYAGNMTAQDSDDVSTTGISTGDGSDVMQILAVYAPNPVISLTGGSATETISISLTNKGFTLRPDSGLIQCATNSNVVGVYDYDASSSTVAYFDLQSVDGTNLPSGNQRFSIQLYEYN